MATIKDAAQIEDVMFDAIADRLRKSINGDVYFPDQRPADSNLMDAVIVVSFVDAKQIQEGRAKVNIFIPDIDNNTGRKVQDREKVNLLRGLDKELVSLLNEADTSYDWSLSQGSFLGKAPTMAEHYWNISLQFKVTTF